MTHKKEPHSEIQSWEGQFWNWKESPLLLSFPGVGSGERAMLKCPRVINPHCTGIRVMSAGRQAAGAG